MQLHTWKGATRAEEATLLDTTGTAEMRPCCLAATLEEETRMFRAIFISVGSCQRVKNKTQELRGEAKEGQVAE